MCGWCAGTRYLPDSGNPTSLCLQAASADGDGPLDGRTCSRWYPPGKTSQPPCANCEQQFATCAACVADDLCGWCAEQHCTEGNAAGPFDPSDPTCTAWAYGSCATQCELIETCDGCAATPGCGWCKNPAHLAGYCISSSFQSGCYQWFEAGASCQPTCASNVNCGSCVANASCGWCGVSATSSSSVLGDCVEGTGAGPFGPQRCPEGWDYGPQSCSLACVSYPDCGGCLQGHEGCGYCLLNGGQCMPGSYNGPSLGECPPSQWVYEPNHCPSNPCPSHNVSCASCVQADSCGWCASDAACYPGYKSSPLAPFYCDPSAWLYAACPAATPARRSPTGSAAPSAWVVALITIGAMLVPISLVAAYVYRKWLLKYGYSPLEG